MSPHIYRPLSRETSVNPSDPSEEVAAASTVQALAGHGDITKTSLTSLPCLPLNH
jgi:hypothetical protein